jgi:ATP-dependent DNA helicase RecQ
MKELEIDLYKELKKYFGFTQFKGLQEQVVTSIISGHNTFVIMPTGGGKSLCYQLPALVLEGTAIVVSPLIALMKNQESGYVLYANSNRGNRLCVLIK